MKKLAILVILLTAVLGAAVWWAGLRAQQQMRSVVALLDAQPQIRVLDSTYSPGWLVSEATTSFELRGAGGAGFHAGLQALDHGDARERIGLHLVHEIEHGFQPLLDWLRAGAEGTPVVARVTSRVALDQETQAELRDALGRFPGLEAHLVVRASGVVEASFEMPAVPLRPRFDPERPTSVAGEFGGLRGSAVISTREGSGAGSVQMPGFSISADRFRLEVQGLEIVFDGAHDPSGVWVGQLTQNVSRVALAARPDAPDAEAVGMGPAPPLDHVLEAEQARIEIDSRVSGPHLQADLSFTLGRLRRDAPEGVAFSGSDARLVLAVEQLNAETLGGLWLASDDLPAPAPGGPLGWLERLAPGAPLLRVSELHMDTPEGPLQGTGELRLQGARRGTLDSLAALADVLVGQLRAEGPAALLGGSEGEPLAGLAEAGWLQVSADRFAVDLALSAGVLRAHGTPVAWPAGPPTGDLAADPAGRAAGELAPDPAGRAAGELAPDPVAAEAAPGPASLAEPSPSNR